MISGSSGVPGTPGPGGPRPSRPVGSIWSRWRDSFGDTHLTLDAVVAHVDGELAPGPAARATEHVARCLLCAGEVAEQRRARGRLRGADTPCASTALLSALRAIPDETLPPCGPAGLGSEAPPPERTGPPAEPGEPDEPDEPGDAGETGRVGESTARRRRGEARGPRRGLPVAVASGIALGSVALAAVPALPITTPVPRSIGPGAAAVAGRSAPGPDAALTVPAPHPGSLAGGPAAPTTTSTAPPGPVPDPTGLGGPDPRAPGTTTAR